MRSVGTASASPASPPASRSCCCLRPQPARSVVDTMCDPSYQDCRATLLNYIRTETQSIDIAMWFMEDQELADAIVERFQAGVSVRAMVDPAAQHRDADERDDAGEVPERRHPDAPEDGRRDPALEVHDLQRSERDAVERRQLRRLLLQAGGALPRLHRRGHLLHQRSAGHRQLPAEVRRRLAGRRPASPTTRTSAAR